MNAKRREHLKELSFKTACREMMYSSGEIDLELVIPRAKSIYDKIVETDYFEYESPFEKPEREEIVEKQEEKTTEVKQGFQGVKGVEEGETKECQWCREKIPAKWTEHKYKSNKVKCGWKEKR